MSTETPEAGTKANEDVARARDLVAGKVLEYYLHGAYLPPLMPGGLLNDEPVQLAAARIARESLYKLSQIYGVERWGPAEFRRYFVEGALSAWEPGTRLEEGERFWTVESPVCPLSDRALKDRRMCHLCRLVQRKVSSTLLSVDVEDAAFSNLILLGDPTCRLLIKRPKKQEESMAQG